MTRYLLFIIFILVSSLILSIKSCQDIRTDRNRLSDNQRALLTDVEFYRTKDSLSAASVERLTLTNDEFRKYATNLEETIKGLNLKVKHLQSISQTSSETKYIVETEIRDSIIVLPDRIDTLECVNYRDPYLTFSGCIMNQQFSGIIQSRDTIVQVVHRVPRRFLFIRWGTKAIRQEIVSRNPQSQSTYTDYIELKK